MTVLSGLQNFITMRLPYLRADELDAAQAEQEQAAATYHPKHADKYEVRAQAAANVAAIAERRLALKDEVPLAAPEPEPKPEDERATSPAAESVPPVLAVPPGEGEDKPKSERITHPELTFPNDGFVRFNIDSIALIAPQQKAYIRAVVPADMKWSRLESVEERGFWEIAGQPAAGDPLPQGAEAMFVVINAAKEPKRFRAVGMGKGL